MKRFFTKAIIAVLVCSVLAAAFAGCANNNETSSAETQPSAGSQPTAQEEKFSLEAIHAPVENPNDPFSGYWKIAEGAGSNLSSFVYLFNGNKMASIIVGNMGYCSSYSIGKDEKTGEDTFKTQLMFGINGEYTYKVSDDGNKITITSDGEDSVLERLESTDFVTAPPKTAEVDEKLTGAWKSDLGIYYYFGEDGRMYSNSYGATFTYYTYFAKDNKVTAAYDMGGEQTETYEYSFDGEKLIFDGTDYTRINPDELMSEIQNMK